MTAPNRFPTARRFLIALLVAWGLAASGSAPAPAQTGGPGPVDPRLFVIGDSVIVGVRASAA
jgi:hypothetical protein